MKFVIDIPDDDYNVILENANFYIEKHWGLPTVWDAIVSGTPLPKGHGRLIDADALLEHSDGGDWNGVCYDSEYVKTRYIYKAQTIIEADKEADNDTV